MDRTKLTNELLRDEGLRLEAYQDTLGFWTIGVGHLLGTERRMLRLTHAETFALLESDINTAEFRASALVGVASFAAMSDTRQRVLVNMSFNLGNKLGTFKKFLLAVNKHDWQTAAAEMMNSRWATQVGARATRLRDMMLKGDDD